MKSFGLYVIFSNEPSIFCIPYYYVKKQNIGGHWTLEQQKDKKIYGWLLSVRFKHKLGYKPSDLL